jgi:ABC-type sugar transport system ATPase subunit
VGKLSNKLKDINFKLYKGELLGIAGIVGADRSELAKALFVILVAVYFDMMKKKVKPKLA